MNNSPLRPGEQFPVVFQISDPSDAATYYPQAIVQDARTLATLATLNLAAQGGGLYSYNYQVPADPTNLGRYIMITLTLYTDANHTTKSLNYQIENSLYLVMDRVGAFQQGGGGADIDYKKIAKLIAEGRVKLPDAPSFGGMEKRMDNLSTIHDQHKEDILNQLASVATDNSELIKTVHEALNKIDQKLLPLTVVQQIEEIRSLVENFDFGEQLQTGLLNTQDIVAQTIKEEVQNLYKMFVQIAKSMVVANEQMRKDLIKEIDDRFSGIDSMVVTKGLPPRDKKSAGGEGEPKNNYGEIAKKLMSNA